MTKLGYFVPFPGRTGLLFLALGTPMEPLADAFVRLSDSIAGSLGSDADNPRSACVGSADFHQQFTQGDFAQVPGIAWSGRERCTGVRRPTDS